MIMVVVVVVVVRRYGMNETVINTVFPSLITTINA